MTISIECLCLKNIILLIIGFLLFILEFLIDQMLKMSMELGSLARRQRWLAKVETTWFSFFFFPKKGIISDSTYSDLKIW